MDGFGCFSTQKVLLLYSVFASNEHHKASCFNMSFMSFPRFSPGFLRTFYRFLPVFTEFLPVFWFLPVFPSFSTAFQPQQLADLRAVRGFGGRQRGRRAVGGAVDDVGRLRRRWVGDSSEMRDMSVS